MISQWELFYGNRNYFRITVNSDHISGYGQHISPHLHIPFSIESLQDEFKGSAWWNFICAIELEFLNATHDRIMSSSGLHMVDADPHSVALPINGGHIDSLTRSANDRRISIPARFVIATRLQPADEKPQFMITMRSSTNYLQLPLSDWYEKILPDMGYPNHRMVPLNTTLPEPLSSLNEPARTTWQHVHQRLLDAEQALLMQSNSPSVVTNGVNALRDAVDGSLRTWLAVWGYMAPDKQDINGLLQTLNSGIPQCNAPEGKTKSKPPITNDNMRLCSHAIALHNIATLTNPTHHFGTQTIYTQNDDAESWLLMTIAEIRSLPELWLQYPKPPHPLTTPTLPHDPSATASAPHNPAAPPPPPAKTSDDDAGIGDA